MPTKTYDLYGFETDDLDFLVEPLEQLLGIKSVARTSGYLGNHNTFDGEGSENFDLRTNIDGEGEWTKSQHKDKGVLLFVNASERPDELKKLLTERIGATLLEREAL